jgi:hypothetical protein
MSISDEKIITVTIYDLRKTQLRAWQWVKEYFHLFLAFPFLNCYEVLFYRFVYLVGITPNYDW